MEDTAHSHPLPVGARSLEFPHPDLVERGGGLHGEELDAVIGDVAGDLPGAPAFCVSNLARGAMRAGDGPWGLGQAETGAAGGKPEHRNAVFPGACLEAAQSGSYRPGKGGATQPFASPQPLLSLNHPSPPLPAPPPVT